MVTLVRLGVGGPGALPGLTGVLCPPAVGEREPHECAARAAHHLESMTGCGGIFSSGYPAGECPVPAWYSGAAQVSL